MPAVNYAVECGDINSDASIDILDVTFLINFLYKGGQAPQDEAVCDVDLSGAVNLLDAAYLIRYLYSSGPEPCRGQGIPESQKYFFEYEYLNWAWGYSLNGIVITNEGYIYHYSYGYNDTPWDTTQPPILSEADLDAKFSHNQILTAIIPMDTLLKYFDMIEPAGEGPISPGIARCFDFGLGTTVAYRYDAVQDNYESILLYRFGDYAQKNFSPEGEALFEWIYEDILGYDVDSIICGYPE